MEYASPLGLVVRILTLFQGRGGRGGEVIDVSTHDLTPIRLPAVLDLTQATQLRDDMLAVLAQGAALLDASEVERMSTPSAQVLLATGRAAQAAGVDFRIVGASETFRNALLDLGLSAEFNNWMD